MGIRILSGTADGDTTAAALYDSTTGWMIGPLFDTGDPVENAEAFLTWFTSGEAAATALKNNIGVRAGGLILGLRGNDPRDFDEVGLERLFGTWKASALDEDGYLKVSWRTVA